MSECLAMKTSQSLGLRLVSAYGCQPRGCWVLLLSWDNEARKICFICTQNKSCKSAMPSPVAFCPAVHFWSGILSWEFFFPCGICPGLFLSVAFCPVAFCPSGIH